MLLCCRVRCSGMRGQWPITRTCKQEQIQPGALKTLVDCSTDMTEFTFSEGRFPNLWSQGHLLTSHHVDLHGTEVIRIITDAEVHKLVNIQQLRNLSVPRQIRVKGIRRRVCQWNDRLFPSLLSACMALCFRSANIANSALCSIYVRLSLIFWWGNNVPPWPKKSLQPRNSWGWGAVRSCDIVRYRALVRHRRDQRQRQLRVTLSSSCTATCRSKSMSHDITWSHCRSISRISWLERFLLARVWTLPQKLCEHWTLSGSKFHNFKKERVKGTFSPQGFIRLEAGTHSLEGTPTTLAQKWPLGLFIKSEHCFYHGISKKSSLMALRCSDARSRGWPRHRANLVSWYCMQEQCSYFMHNPSGRFLARVVVQYSLMQWNWFSDVTGCTWITCISDVREPTSLHQAVVSTSVLSLRSIPRKKTVPWPPEK